MKYLVGMLISTILILVAAPINASPAVQQPGASNSSIEKSKNNKIFEESIKKRNPKGYEIEYGNLFNYIELRGGALGSITRSAFKSEPEQAIKSYLLTLQELTLFGPNIELTGFKERVIKNGSSTLIFHQIINGIKVSVPNQIRIDPEGNVIFVHMALMDEKLMPVLAIEEIEAIERAKQAVLGKYRIGASTRFSENIEVTRQIELISLNAMAVVWNIKLVVEEPGSGTGAHYVAIDATTGEASIIDTIIHFGVDVCKQVGVNWTIGGVGIVVPETPEVKCEDQPYFGIPDLSQVEEIYENGVCVASTTTCNQAIYKKPKEILEDFSDWVDASTQSSAVPNIDVMTNSDRPSEAPQSPYYDVINRAIFIPSPTAIESPPFIATDMGQVIEAMVHEASHHVFIMSNDGLEVAFSSQYASGKAEGAMLEGFSDAMAALFETQNGVSESKAWVIGDDSFPGAARDLRILRDLSYYENTSGVHAAGLFYGSMIHKMWKTGASVNDLRDFVLASMRDVVRSSHEGSFIFNLPKMISVMQAYLSDKPALRVIWEGVLAQQGALNLIGDVGAPPAPPGIAAYFSYCGQGNTFYVLDWLNVSGATTYKVYYRLFGLYILAHETTASSVLAWTPVNTKWKLKSCNASGCSALSEYGVSTPHFCF